MLVVYLSSSWMLKLRKQGRKRQKLIVSIMKFKRRKNKRKRKRSRIGRTR